MSVEFYSESPGKFDSRTLHRKTLNRWTGRIKLLEGGEVARYPVRRPGAPRPSHVPVSALLLFDTSILYPDL